MADKLFASNDVSEYLAKALDSHETFFGGDNPSFPPVEGLTFEHLLAMRGYDEAKKGASEEILSMPVEKKKDLLSKIVVRCQGLEEQNRKALEKLCFNIVNKLFAIPNGAITFRCHLVNDLQGRDRNLRAKPEDSPDMEYDSIREMRSLKTEVAKRQVVNALVMGAAMKYSKLPKQFIGEVYEIDPELPKLYKDYATLNSLILYEDKLPEVSEQTKFQGGMVEVHVAGVGMRTLVESYGTIFPVLLCESIRGFMELFSSHGLPNKKTSAEYVMKKCDCVEAEVWNMILGPEMWNMFVSVMGDMDIKYLPMLFTRISELDAEEFCEIMQEVFGKTRNGKAIMEELVAEVVDEIDYEDFEDSVAMKNMRKNLIAEKYMTVEELDAI